MRRFTRLALVLGLVLLVTAIAAQPGQAQPRFRGHQHATILVGGYFGYPYYSAFYDPFFYPYSPWGPYSWQGYPPRGDEGREQTIGIRTDISPKEAQLYVDGYFRGTASDFDGLFKRLRIAPGPHELVIYLKGYRTVRQSLDLQPGTDYRVREKLQRLAPGETSEAAPTPPPAPPKTETAEPRGDAPAGQPAPDEPRRPMRPRRAPMPAEAQGFGAIAIRVQPAGAEVLIDGERWQGPEGPAPLLVQVALGPHRVEVRKDGYAPYTTEIEVRQGETARLNVSLPARQ
jgi:hypothetical protein